MYSKEDPITELKVMGFALRCPQQIKGLLPSLASRESYHFLVIGPHRNIQQKKIKLQYRRFESFLVSGLVA